MNAWEFEEEQWNSGVRSVCGVDEAGAGPLAGPVYAAAVILPPYAEIEGLDDSKKLTERRREALFPVIQERALAWSVAFVEAEEIDRIDILNARIKAMQLAIDALAVPAELALVDGNRDHGSLCALTTPHRLIVKGDSRSASIAAASILAKVSRDRFLTDVLDREYPQYQFARHKGYGTKLHYEMLDQHGPSPVHRLSFLKKWERRR
ncbi:ribonuclease HII [Oscillibacter hominis]|nr:ribonuclease HII [Oscillibacter hominis]